MVNTTGQAPDRLWMRGNVAWEAMGYHKRPPKGGAGVLYIREDVAAEAIDAARAKAGATTVRPLEWAQDESGCTLWRAKALGIRYYVAHTEGGWGWSVDGFGLEADWGSRPAGSEDEARAAAQADFAARVLAVLGPSPTPPGPPA